MGNFTKALRYLLMAQLPFCMIFYIIGLTPRIFNSVIIFQIGLIWSYYNKWFKVDEE